MRLEGDEADDRLRSVRALEQNRDRLAQAVWSHEVVEPVAVQIVAREAGRALADLDASLGLEVSVANSAKDRDVVRPSIGGDDVEISVLIVEERDADRHRCRAYGIAV